MLKIKLFRGFALIVLLFAALSAIVGVRTIRHRVIEQAQNRVRLDLSSAWAVHESKLDEIRTILEMTAINPEVANACAQGDWEGAELRSRLEQVRAQFGLDFLDLVAPDGKVVLRSTPPYAVGDYRVSDPVARKALQGEGDACMLLLSREELLREAEGLTDKAFLEIEDTPRARQTQKSAESRGMVMVGAMPVQHGAQVLGAVYGGILVNRNHALIDRIHDVVYKGEQYKGRQLGTATIFLDDMRVSTTVRRENGNRALGTRVSKEVADRVLDNAMPWIGEAFVVRDWYLTAYDPVYDCEGSVIGMLYVGILKKPFQDYTRSIVLRYLFVSLFVMVVGLALAFFIAGRLAQPIHRLVQASNAMSQGRKPEPVPCDNACHETEALIGAFNQMANTLAEREERLKALNRSYMETLGFVSHELKSPVASIMNYVYLLREEKLGPLTDKQQKAVKCIDGGSTRLVEMVKHYLNLSRIENGELAPVRSRVELLDEVVEPVLEAVDADVEAKGMQVVNEIGADLLLHADRNMVREVFENLVSNAIKYGGKDGRVELKAVAQGEYMEFSVWNEGPGIPEDKIKDLFGKFSRLEDSEEARRQKGTGLGLFITKHIVEGHGGSIRAESRVGEWVNFIFTLPIYQESGKEG